MWDVIVVGGGPAGLSAALILGRCRRSVLVCDSGRYRNESSSAMHGFLTREGIEPSEFLHIARQELDAYGTVSFKRARIAELKNSGKQFDLITEAKEILSASKIILATGLRDEIPQIKGIGRFYGKSVFLCPYCDAWECRESPMAVYGQKERGPAFALMMSRWSHDLILCTDGPMIATDQEQDKLAQKGIRVIEDRIERLEGNGDQLKKIVFKDHPPIERKILFFNTQTFQASDLAEKAGCKINAKGDIETDADGHTSIPGLFVAGDASSGLKMSVVAAGEGARAAFCANKQFIQKELSE